jgi:hypothetical protein
LPPILLLAFSIPEYYKCKNNYFIEIAIWLIERIFNDAWKIRWNSNNNYTKMYHRLPDKNIIKAAKIFYRYESYKYFRKE